MKTRKIRNNSRSEVIMFKAYEIIKEEELADIASRGILLKHKKSGAHVALIINDDNNKVFDIAFRTPPKDSTGVAHIIEHTVLCGSKKFPLKDPFVELAKGSLNTFLNAMTYPDKTMYPVASCNDADFKNLMEVYLDSVFYPNIYENRRIFEQEGWHYHLENKDDRLKHNGVVYNEMKGVYSSADAVLESTVLSNLFPDTTYGLESGGDPEVIPQLTYEQYLDFHRTYYHPSNSYIYLYGNMDMEERLAWMDKEYLSRFDKKEIDSRIEYQAPFDKMKTVRGVYPVLDGEPLKDNTYLNMSVVTGDYSDIVTGTAMNILTYVLLDAPGAPLKKALIDAGVGKDVSGSYNDGILQPYFSVDVKYANGADNIKFKRVIRETLSRLCDKGLDEKALRAAIHYYEFRFREADFSVYPKGLIYIMSAFDTWLYDENRPFDCLKELTVFDELKKKIGTGYFEELIRERILKNNHKVVTILRPQRNLAAKREEKYSQQMSEYKASLSEEEIARIIDETAALEEYQKREDTPETLAMLPVLSVSDIDAKTPIELHTEEKEAGGIRILRHKYDTRGISYLNLLFEADDIPHELLPYMSLLSSVLGYVNTEKYSYSDLSNEINARTGGIECGLSIFADKDGGSKKYFGIRSKYLDPECGFALDMMREIICTSKLDDMKRLKEIITSKKAYLQEYIPAAGHMSAVSKAAAGISDMNDWQERIAGVTYYRFIESLFADFDERKSETEEKLKKLAGHLFRKDNLVVSVTADDEGFEYLKKEINIISDNLRDTAQKYETEKFVPYDVKDAVVTAGQVQFAASAGNYIQAGYKPTGVLNVLRTMLNYDYLWKNLREKGGAYGCMSAFKRTGDAYLVSYRDPHLANTLKVYEGLADYLAVYEADDKTMEKYIIGTISSLDTPMNAKAKGNLALVAYFAGLTQEDFQKERDEILKASAADIRKLESLIRDTFDGKHICVLGSEAAVEKHEELFDSIEAFVQA
jgi:Zn-dependent M16 (insulinase) family peptidase